MTIKYFLIVLTTFLMFGTSVYAQTNTGKEETIKSLVEKVKQAPPSQKRVLMNQLKVKLRSMSKENRQQVMMDLRHAFNAERRIRGVKGMTTSMQQSSASMMDASKNMKDAMNQGMMNRNNMSGGGMPGGGMPGGGMNPSPSMARGH